EPGAHAADVAQRGAVGHPEQQRADPARAAALRPPPAHHAGLREPVGDLRPAGAAPPRPVDPVAPLRDDALHPPLARGVEQRRPVGVDRGERDHRHRGEVEPFEGRAALGERALQERHAVEPQHVEHHERDRAGLRDPRRDGAVHPLGQRREAGHAVLQQHDLAVEQHVRHEVGERRELGEAGRDVALAATGEPHPAVGDVGEQPHAVPLHLEQPFRAAREGTWGGEHGQHAAMLAPELAKRGGTGARMRAMWSGAVSFGLVSVPVKAYAATSSHDIRFHQVHAADGGRIRYKRTCSIDGEEVDYADIVKGYETEDGELIILDEEDLDSLPTKSSHEIDVVEFVPADQIDPLLYDKSYYLEPEAKAAKPYALLREALVQTDRMAVVKVALRQRESIALLRVRGKAIVLQTMLWPDEVREPDFDILDAEVELRPQEL